MTKLHGLPIQFLFNNMMLLLLLLGITTNKRHTVEAFGIVSTCTATRRRRASSYSDNNNNNKLICPSHSTLPALSIQQRITTTLPLPTAWSYSSLHMALVPLPVEELEELLVTGLPTASQYSTYWGRTSREQYSNFFESATVTFLGVFCSYFLSFVVGSFPATLLGFLFAFWTILSPELKAFSRNWELRGGRELVDIWTVDPNQPQDKQGLYGSLFIGHVQDVSVVTDSTTTREEYDLEDFQDYTMEYDEQEQWTGNPYLLRLQIKESESESESSSARELQIHVRMSEEYLDIQPNQPVVGVLLSTSQSFTKLAAMTDLYIPDAECWVGDYPYLDRFVMEELLANDDDIWNLLESERYSEDEDEYDEEFDDDADDDEEEYDSYYDDDDDDENNNDDSQSSSPKDKVPIRKRGRRP